MLLRVNEMIRRAMITVKQGLETECPFLTRGGTSGILCVHFRPQGDPRITWERDFKVSYKDNEVMSMRNAFSRDLDSDNRDLALDVIEYTLFQYVDPKRKVISGKLQFNFSEGIISNILASGSLIYEDCEG